MVGSFLGGEFANCVLWAAHREWSKTTNKIVAIDPFTYAPGNSTVVSKLAMLAASEFMVASGIMLGSLISERDMQSEDCIARMVTALYMVYIHMLMHMSGVSGVSLNGTDEKTRHERIDDMRKSNPPIQEMCKIALGAISEMEKHTGANLKRDAAISTYSRHEILALAREIDATGTEIGFMRRKLMKEFNESTGTFRTISGGEEVHVETGIIANQTILTELFRVLQGRENINNVYKVIYYVILSFDCGTMKKDASGHIHGGFGSSTYAEIPGGEADMLRLDNRDSTIAAEVGTSRVSENPILLGSILLSQSEQRMQQEIANAAGLENEVDTAAAALPAASEEEEDVNNSSRSPTSTQETSAAQGGGGKKKSVGFKRVQAKLL